MENKEIDINDYLNNFLNKYHKTNYLKIQNLGPFYELSKFVHEQTKLKNETERINWYKVNRSSFLQNIKLINNFFKSINVEFNIEDIIKDGTINIQTNDLDEILESKRYRLGQGNNHYLGNHKSININNNGLISDSVVWVHEISHYRNQSDERRGQTNDLLTEALASTYELIYIDYLEELGYAYEAYHARAFLLDFFHYISDQASILTKMFLLYEELGDTSKESYKYFYKKADDYDEVKGKFINMMKNDPMIIFKSIDYTVAAAYSIYMYNYYSKNRNFINNIEKLNMELLNNKDLVTCLRTIDLNEYISESIIKMEEAFTNFKKLLEGPTPQPRVLKK